MKERDMVCPKCGADITRFLLWRGGIEVERVGCKNCWEQTDGVPKKCFRLATQITDDLGDIVTILLKREIIIGFISNILCIILQLIEEYNENK